MVQYRNGLIGKHFKAIRQTISFHLHHELEDKKLLAMFKAAGELGALLWYHTIENMNDYLVSSLAFLEANTHYLHPVLRIRTTLRF